MSADLETTPSDSEPRELTSKYARLTLNDKARILILKDEGLTQTEIAHEIGCTQSTVAHTLATFKAKEDVVKMLLIGKVEDRIANWDKAEQKAAERGDHRPTKERLEMAMEKLRSQPGHGAGGGGVTVIVAVPGSTNPLPTIDVSPLHPRTSERNTTESLVITSTSHKPDSVNQS
jgi:predicted transcriptional regulator